MKKDIAVIGGGVIGLMSAWRLAQAGASVVVVERNRVGSASTGAAVGALIPYTFSRTVGMPTFQRNSLRQYPALAQELQTLTGINIGYTQGGRIYMFSSPGQRENAERDVLKSDGHQRVIDDFPAEPDILMGPHGALYCDLSAWLSVEHYVQALVKACQLAGVTILEETALKSMDEAYELADQVLVAAGSWTQQLVPSFKVAPVKGQALILKLPEQRFSHIIRRGTCYLVPHADGRIVVGSTTEPEAGFDTTTTAEAREALLKKACAIAPVMAEAEVVAHHAGLRPKRMDRHPPMLRIDERTVVASGHFKIGFCLAPAVAQSVVQEMFPST